MDHQVLAVLKQLKGGDQIVFGEIVSWAGLAMAHNKDYVKRHEVNDDHEYTITELGLEALHESDAA